MPSYSRALITFLKILQNGKWIKDKELLSNLEIWRLGAERTRFTCEVGKDLTIAWELVYTVDITKMIEVRYSEGELSKKVMGAHAIIHHIGPFSGIPSKVLNLGEENFVIDNNAKIDINSLNKIVYDSELYRLPNAEKFPDNILSIINGRQKGLQIQLTQEQAEILRKRTGPLLLSGEAGSGKTTIITHWFLLNLKDWFEKLQKGESNRPTPYKQLFVTLNENLTSETKNYLQVMLPNDFKDSMYHEVQFLTYRELLFDILDMSGKKHLFSPEKEMDFEAFNRIYSSTVLQKGLDAVLVWDEIRSVIKGTSEIGKKLIEKEKYTNLNKNRGQTKVPERFREKYYDEAERYQTYLQDNEYWDSIDLARECYSILKSGNHDFPLYDFMACDEVQDLAEVEILTLLNLVSDGRNEFGPRLERMFFTGDTAQVINPSGFTWNGLKRLLSKQSGRKGEEMMDPIHLARNFRSTEQIVDLTNAALETRIGMLGKHPDLRIQNSEKKGKDKPMRIVSEIKTQKLANTMEAAKAILNAGVVDSTKRMIIVKNRDEKEALYELIGGSNAASVVLLTIEEAKGLEREGVILWKFFKPRSDVSKDEWENVFIERKRKFFKKEVELERKNRYALDYEFNLLHVALTRAKAELYIYDDDTDMNIGEISTMVEKTTPIVPESLSTFWQTEQPDTPEKMFETATMLKKRDKPQSERWFQKAARAYQEKGNYVDAADSFIEAGDYSAASKCYESAGNKERALWSSATAAKDDPQTWELHANICKKENKISHAKESYKEAISCYEKHEDYEAAGVIGEQIAKFYQNLEENYHMHDYFGRCILNYERAGKKEEAIRILRKANSLAKDPERKAKYLDSESKNSFELGIQDSYKISERAALEWNNANRVEKQISSLEESISQQSQLKTEGYNSRKKLIDVLKKKRKFLNKCIDEWKKIITIFQNKGNSEKAWRETEELVDFMVIREHVDPATKLLENHLEWAQMNKIDGLKILEKYVACLNHKNSTANFTRRGAARKELAEQYYQNNNIKKAKREILDAAENAMISGNINDSQVGANTYFEIAMGWELKNNTPGIIANFCLNEICLEYGLRFWDKEEGVIGAGLTANQRLAFMIYWADKAIQHYAKPKKEYMRAISRSTNQMNKLLNNEPEKGMSRGEWKQLANKTKGSIEGRMKGAWTNYCKGKVMLSRTKNIKKDEKEIIACFKEANNWLAIRGRAEFTGIENASFNFFRNEIENIEGIGNKLEKDIAKYEKMLKAAMKDGELSNDEEELLNIRRKELSITEQKHNELMKKYAKSPTKKKRQIKKKKESKPKVKRKQKKHTDDDTKSILKAIDDFYGLNYGDFIIARAVDGMPHEAAKAIIEQMIEEDIIENVNYDKPQEKIKLTKKWEEIRKTNSELAELKEDVKELKVIEDKDGVLVKVKDLEKLEKIQDKVDDIENKITGKPKRKNKKSVITKKLEDKDNIVMVDEDKVKSKKRKRRGFFPDLD